MVSGDMNSAERISNDNVYSKAPQWGQDVARAGENVSTLGAPADIDARWQVKINQVQSDAAPHIASAVAVCQARHVELVAADNAVKQYDALIAADRPAMFHRVNFYNLEKATVDAEKVLNYYEAELEEVRLVYNRLIRNIKETEKYENKAWKHYQEYKDYHSKALKNPRHPDEYVDREWTEHALRDKYKKFKREAEKYQRAGKALNAEFAVVKENYQRKHSYVEEVDQQKKVAENQFAQAKGFVADYDRRVQERRNQLRAPYEAALKIYQASQAHYNALKKQQTDQIENLKYHCAVENAAYNAHALYQQGLSQEGTPQAAELFEQAIAISPHYVSAHFASATTHEILEQRDMAFRRYSSTLSLEPQHERSATNLERLKSEIVQLGRPQIEEIDKQVVAELTVLKTIHAHWLAGKSRGSHRKEVGECIEVFVEREVHAKKFSIHSDGILRVDPSYQTYLSTIAQTQELLYKHLLMKSTFRNKSTALPELNNAVETAGLPPKIWMQTTLPSRSMSEKFAAKGKKWVEELKAAANDKERGAEAARA